MPYCIHCGTQVADNAKFCQHCGTPLGGSQAVDPPTLVSSEADSPTPVDSEPVSSETETALSESQTEADPPTPVGSEPVSSEPKTSCLSRMIGPFKAFILLIVLHVLALNVWHANAYAGLVVGLIYLVVPGVAIFKPNPKIWLGHRGLNFCMAFLGVCFIMASVYILGEESPNQSATTRSIGAVTRSTPTPTPTPIPTPTATPTFAVTGGLHDTLPSSTPTATFTPTTTSTPAPTTTSTPVPTATPTVTATPTASEALKEFIFCERLRVLNELEWGISPSTVYSDNPHFTGVIPEGDYVRFLMPQPNAEGMMRIEVYPKDNRPVGDADNRVWIDWMSLTLYRFDQLMFECEEDL